MDTTEKTPRRSRKLKVTAGATAVMIAGSLGAVALFDNAGAAPGDNAKYTITLNARANTGNTNSVPARRSSRIPAPQPRSSRSRARRPRCAC